MKPSYSAAVVVTSSLLASLSGCDCRGKGTNTQFGEIQVIWRDANNERKLDRDATYDFGSALLDESKELTLTVKNAGAGLLSLDSLVLTDGDETAIPAATGSSTFDVAFVEKTTIKQGMQADFPMHFTPKSLQGEFTAKLLLTASGVPADQNTAIITLKGQGEKGRCDIPDTIDFGQVAVGETFPYTLPFVNPTALEVHGLAGDITGADATAFAYAASSPHGDVTVAPRTTANVVLNFAPTEKRMYTAQAQMRGPGNCPEKTVNIKGEGGDATLTWSPSSLNFGNVNPGSESIQEVIFVNPSTGPVTLSMVASSEGSFYQSVAMGQDATKFTVPGGSVPTSMKVGCNPIGLGKHTGTLTFKTGLTRVPTGTIALECSGGGPRIKVTPRPTLAFGRVGFFPNNTTFNVTRKVNVQNVGSRPNPPDPKANLYLGKVVAGTPGGTPLFELVPKNAQTDRSEFNVSLGSAYNSAVGLEAVAGKNAVDLVVTLTPKSQAAKEAELIIYSNDASEPAVHIAITADAQQLAPCKYKTSPATANFGLVAPGSTKDLPVTITNEGTTAQDICYLSGIDLAAGTNAAYSIVGGPIVEKELQAGQSLQVVVRVAPTGATPTTLQTLTGALTFNATNPASPQGNVPLRTSVGPSCLAVTPDPLDFGTVKLGCNSPSRTFNVYNVCTSNVTVTSFAMQAAAGQPYGGPNCNTMGGCPEFFLTSAPSIPGGGLVLVPGASPVTFNGKYKPIDVGSDSGAIAINAIQDGQSVTYLVALAGRGDTIGEQTDTFMQDQQPKADILMVVDDSGSMGDKQASLASNFASFIQYPVSANVDYHIAVTTTTWVCEPQEGLSCQPVARGGDFYKDPTLGIRVITPATPNVSTVFSRMVKVGTDGSGHEQGLETAVAALTPPKIANENVGFLRTEANLAVVVVSDAADQSAQPVSYYQNRLLNVKGFNNLSMFTFSNIGPYLANSPINCQYDPDSDPARYQQIVTATAGVKDEICNSNWSTALQNLGRTAFGYRTQWYLNNVPDLSGGHTIVVKVNGTVIAQGPNTWSYDSGTNSIKFSQTSRPGPGQTLTVTYTTTCGP